MGGEDMKLELHRKSRRKYQKIISVILCIAVIAATASIAYGITPDFSVYIEKGNDRLTELTLPQGEKTVLTASAKPAGNDVSYQWQVQDDIKTDSWVNIYEKTDKNLSVSYALLFSMLNEAGNTYIRCEAKRNGETVYSEPVCVTVTYDADVCSAKNSAIMAASENQDNSDDSATPEYVRISVNYLDAVSGLPIYSGYKAQIEYHTSYSNSVVSPTYLGYAPYYNQNDVSAKIDDHDESYFKDSAEIIMLDVPETYDKSEYTVNVYYKAIDVPYAARYYFQNIHDDQYTEDIGLYKIGSAKTGTIIANDTLAAIDQSKTLGFTKLYHYPEAVAADGSTVFECYYDRNYYMLKFDMDGGYGVEPIYARYATPFVVNEPTRAGYVFAGWDLIVNGQGDGIADTLPKTIPAESRTYKAIWKNVQTTYTTVYWLQDADDDDYSYIGNVRNTAESGSKVSGSGDLTANTDICGNTSHEHTASCKPENFRQYVFDHADQDVIVKGDGSTVVNVYYNRREYTLRFYYAKEYFDPTKGMTEPDFSIVGGSTRKFGHQQDGVGNHGSQYSRPKDANGNILNDVESLLDNVVWSEWGKVERLPDISSPDGVTYTHGVTPETGYNSKYDRYYYFEFTARYGEDLTKLWPSDAFGKVKVKNPASHTKNGANNYLDNDQWGNYAYFAGWNGEYNVKYNWDNFNSTIKCYYPALTDELLYDPRFYDEYGDPDTINFLGFFNNGANVSWSIPNQWIYELYVPTLAGDTPTLTYQGVDYKLVNTIYTADNNKSINDQTQPPLPGFERLPENQGGKIQINNGTIADGRESYTARLFYTRSNYYLAMQNHNSVQHFENIPYESPLDSYAEIVPSYPDTLEQNAYAFAGWYYSPGCYDGSEYTPGDKMSAQDVGLYAKWEPVSHDVRMFKTYDDMLRYEATGDTSGLISYHPVPHGSILGSVDNPTDESEYHYSFGGWFFMSKGIKTAYTPLDMPVTRDLNVFADWGSLQAQPYIIHYALHNPETNQEWLELLDNAADGYPENNKIYTVSNGNDERKYVYLESDNKYHLQIAGDSNGFAYQGNTRTFLPKAGEPYSQLSEGYNNGYFPTVGSHSITIEYEENKESPSKNVFTFTYVYATDIRYRVEYRYLDTDELIPSAPGEGIEEKTTSMAVMTERFAVIKDYIPDAFYKRLILAVEKDENGDYVGSSDNVITFYYTKNTQHAFYAVHNMLQNIDAESDTFDKDADGNYINFTESGAHTEGIGEIDSVHNIEPQKFSGFTVMSDGYLTDTGKISMNTDDPDRPHFQITVKAEGTELYIFYKRNIQNYKVYYLKYGTDISDLSSLTYDESDKEHTNGVVLPIDEGKASFGSTLTASAKPVSGMSCASNISQSIIIRANDDQNYIIFYYSSLKFTVEYKVWSYGGGSIDNTTEAVHGTTQFKGANATASNGYKFDGWYLDDQCTVPAVSDPAQESDKASVSGSEIVPITLNLDPVPATNVFYAKFVPYIGDLTITRNNAGSDESGGTQTFVYKITSIEDPDFVVYATISGNGSVTVKNLVCRDYTIEQLNGWSWRYSDKTQTVTVTGNGTSAVFDEISTRQNWLNGNSASIKNRRL